MTAEVADKTLILLAGGQGSRFGAPKGLQSINGKLFIEWQLERFRAAGGLRTVVVLGFAHEEYQRRLAPSLADFVVNPAPERGAFSSLLTGLETAASGPGDAFFVLPIDVPSPSPEVWAALAAPACGDFDVVQPVHAGRGGHPVRLSPAFGARLRQLDVADPDSRLDRQIQSLPRMRVFRHEVADPSIVANLNTLEAWLSWELQLDKGRPTHNI